jgi:DNA primase small subunit
MEGKTQAERLEAVKRIVKDQLLDDFLLDDFGFSRENVRVVFSGGRGYHIHVSDPKVLTLESPERREIVDYITGVGLDHDRIFKKEVVQVTTFGPHSKVDRKVSELADVNEPGWKGRLTMGIFKLLSQMDEISKDDCINLIMSEKYEEKKVGDARAETIYNLLFEGEIGQRIIDTIRTERNLERITPDQNRDIFINLARRKASVAMAGETDEPVTVDTRRLIRMQDSLHGKSGLRVVTVPIDDLDDFEPLRDALAFDDASTKIKLKSDAEFDIGDEHYTLAEGDCELPKYAAIYLMCRGLADIR